MGPHNISERRICAKERENVFAVERRERRDVQVHIRTIEEMLYQILKVILNSTSIFCRKERWEKRMVQDYWYLNKWTVKNNYSLPLISDVIKNIGTKKIFTKMDLR